MSYSYSFSSSTPIGFTINSTTGLITIADTAPPFTGPISVQVSDGVNTIAKSISIVLTTPVKTPLLMQTSEGRAIGGGMIKIQFLDIISALAIGGGTINIAFSGVGQNLSVAETGPLAVTSTFEEDGGGGY